MVDFDKMISFHGDVIATDYQSLVDAFGNPTDCDIDGKVQCEWEITTPNGTTFNIYDWKEYFLDVRCAPIVEWHIGRTPKSKAEINAFLAEKGFEMTESLSTSLKGFLGALKNVM